MTGVDSERPWRTRLHEAAHAVVAHELGLEPILGVSWGDGSGQVRLRGHGEQMTVGQARRFVATCCAGVLAELLYLGNCDWRGADGDIEQVIRISLSLEEYTDEPSADIRRSAIDRAIEVLRHRRPTVEDLARDMNGAAFTYLHRWFDERKAS